MAARKRKNKRYRRQNRGDFLDRFQQIPWPAMVLVQEQKEKRVRALHCGPASAQLQSLVSKINLGHRQSIGEKGGKNG